MKTVTASHLRTRCHAVLREVEATRVPVIVTKRGRPVVRVCPLNGDRTVSANRKSTPPFIQLDRLDS